MEVLSSPAESVAIANSTQGFDVFEYVLTNWAVVIFNIMYVMPAACAFIYVNLIMDFLYPIDGSQCSQQLKEGENILKDTNDLSNKGVGANPDKVGEKVEVIKLSREEMKRVDIAYPTIILCLVAFSIWLTTFALYSKGYLHPVVAYLINSVCTFVIFTPLHDCTHNAVSPKHKLINNAVGLISGIPLFAPYSIFRFIHLSHHRYCNDVSGAPDGSSLDPDSFTGNGPTLLLPLNWATTLGHYLLYTFKVLHWRAKDPSLSPQAREVDRQMYRDVIASIVFYMGLSRYAIHYHGNAFGVCWILPALTAVTFLAYAFDYLPHRPHEVSYRENPYTSTSMVSMFKDAKTPEFFMQVMLLNQCFHNVHHLCPWIPFYAYPTIWHNHKEDFLRLGTNILPIFLWAYPGQDLMKDLRKDAAKTKEKSS